MLEAWQLRERQGGEGALNPRHTKKKKIYHFTSASWGWGVETHLQFMEDRCSAEENYGGSRGPKAILKWLYSESRLSSSALC